MQALKRVINYDGEDYIVIHYPEQNEYRVEFPDGSRTYCFQVESGTLDDDPERELIFNNLINQF